MSWNVRSSIVLLIPLAAGPIFAADAEQIKADEKLLQAAQVGTGETELLDFFRMRAAGADRERIADLVRQLGDAREAGQAMGKLVALGRPAVPVLQEELKTKPSGAAAARIKQCLQWLDGPDRYAIPAAAARLLGQRKPAGTVTVLLAYYPVAEAEGVQGEIREALTEAGLVKGKADPALAAALGDEAPLLRALAAEILVQIGAIEQRPAVRRLLKDPDAGVRLKTALALFGVRDQAALAVLIDSLADLPASQARDAEDALLQLAGAFAPPVRLEKNAASRKNCHESWTTWWASSAGPALLDYFRARTLPDADQDKVAGLIRLLSNSSYAIREKATADLIALRTLAAPLLKEALRSRDLETQKRSRHCLEVLTRAAEAPQTALKVRLLALRHPTQAAEVLLNFMPFADDESVELEIAEALKALAREHQPVLRAALARLNDKFPQRRALAAEALAPSADPEHRKAVRKLLKDTAPIVRLRAGLALASQKERDAIPVLIALLAELPVEQGQLAEEVLCRLADADGPAVPLGGDAAAQLKCRDAWARWWQTAANVDLTRLEDRGRTLGYTVLARWNFQGQTNEVVELGLNGQVRWKIDGLGHSFDFQLLPGRRILLAEHTHNRVTERNFKGEVLWEVKIPGPLNCQRLPNGNTFIAANTQLMEVDRASKILYTIQRPNMSGRKLTDGRIAMLESGGNCIWMDTNGKELKRVNVSGGVNNLGGMDALPAGRVMFSLLNQNKVLELDADGKTVWQVTQPGPNFATRLPNGHTLITSQTHKYAVEVDRTGRVIWQHRPDLGVWRARRR